MARDFAFDCDVPRTASVRAAGECPEAPEGGRADVAACGASTDWSVARARIRRGRLSIISYRGLRPREILAEPLGDIRSVVSAAVKASDFPALNVYVRLKYEAKAVASVSRILVAHELPDCQNVRALAAWKKKNLLSADEAAGCDTSYVYRFAIVIVYVLDRHPEAFVG